MNRPIEVMNRSNGFVAYVIPDKHIRREFNPRETKKVEFDELVEVSMQAGGRELLYHYLMIKDANSMREILNVNEEPEYWLTEAKIPDWMASCSLNEFKDALDFAPQGVKDLIKKFAVSLPLNDVAKREAILTILGFDVTKAIEVNRESAAAGEESANAPASASKRRTVSTVVADTEPKYKVVNRAE